MLSAQGLGSWKNLPVPGVSKWIATPGADNGWAGYQCKRVFSFQKALTSASKLGGSFWAIRHSHCCFKDLLKGRTLGVLWKRRLWWFHPGSVAASPRLPIEHTRCTIWPKVANDWLAMMAIPQEADQDFQNHQLPWLGGVVNSHYAWWISVKSCQIQFLMFSIYP